MTCRRSHSRLRGSCWPFLSLPRSSYVGSCLFQKIPREWKLIAFTGILQFAVNYSAVFWSEQYITSGLAAVLQATITVFGLLLAWIFLPSERITKLKIFAVLIGVAGVAVIFADQLRVNDLRAFAGCVAIVVGAYAAAQASILVKAKAGSMHPASLVMMQMAFGLPAIITYALAAEGNPLAWNWTPRDRCVRHLSFRCRHHRRVLALLLAIE